MTKEELIEKIRDVHKNEKFRLDAYFFCGFPSGTPNEALLNACGAYLDAVDNGQPTQEAAAGLIAQLEATANAKPKIADVNNILNNLDSVTEILSHRDLL